MAATSAEGNYASITFNIPVEVYFKTLEEMVPGSSKNFLYPGETEPVFDHDYVFNYTLTPEAAVHTYGLFARTPGEAVRNFIWDSTPYGPILRLLYPNYLVEP